MLRRKLNTPDRYCRFDTMTDIAERVDALRVRMKEHGVDAYLVGSADEHQNEYVPDCWRRRHYISGFTGSAGDVVVTADEAALWTDGRYHLQAEEQLDLDAYTLFKSGLEDVPEREEWLVETLDDGATVGVDPKLLSMKNAKNLEKTLEDHDLVLKWVRPNLVDSIWAEQPSRPTTPVELQTVAFAGETVEEKLARLREKLDAEGATAHVLTALDAIAWLLNIRGGDIDYNPLNIAYALIADDRCVLAVDPVKLSDEVRGALRERVQFVPYDAFDETLQTAAADGGKFWLDPTTTSQWIRDLLTNAGADKIYEERSPVTDFKARKNETEIEGLKSALVRDGVAMVRFLAWLDRTIHTAAEPEGELTEQRVAKRLEQFRAQGEHFRGLSFETISAYGPHGAIIHYAVTDESDSALKPEGLYLVDSGGQYLDGTTDITRTVALGEPTDEERAMFTRVLKGHIALATLQFPKGTSGHQIDMIARKPLWEIGENYLHGTGHGVGAYLNVHEGPQRISHRGSSDALAPMMILSNEPGYYRSGAYGIRTENLVLVIERDEVESNYGPFYGFETQTLCPIDLRLVEPSLLTEAEHDWLNTYHAAVREAIEPLLQDEEERKWLRAATRAL